jgi:16S rRNA (guanine(966)-N(2))-methyltransferase RsmD
MIRIIAGTKKNRRILSLPFSHHVKPISARMRKSLFDILRPYITGSIFLDLYAGIGVVGLEALSRGSQKVVFVENDIKCINTIKRNLKKLEFEKVAHVVKADVLKDLIFLKYYSQDGYDIVFMGPPYRDENNNILSYTEPTLKNVVNGSLLSEYGIVIAQHHIKEKFSIPDKLIKFRSERYGDTIIDFFKQKSG